MRPQASPEVSHRLRNTIAAGTVAALAVVGARSCAEDPYQLLPPDEVAAACQGGDLQIGFRGNTSPQAYGSIEANNLGDVSVGQINVRFFANTPKDIAVASIAEANPNLTIVDETSVVPENASVRFNISSFDRAVLPADTALGEYGQSLGFDDQAMTCLNGLSPDISFDHDVSVLLPRQVSSDATPLMPVVVRPGDTYSSIAQANGVSLESITDDQLSARNLVPATKLQPGDITYIEKPNGTAEIVEPNQETTDFAEQYMTYAVEVEEAYGVPRQVVLAQAILESGYGKSELAKHAHNFFGLKANSEWTGPVYEKATKEVVSEEELAEYEDRIIDQVQRDDGAYEITINDRFKAFADDKEGFMGFGAYLKERGNGTFYADAFEAQDPYEFVRRLVDDNGPRYATDPEYFSKVSKIIDALNSNTTAGVPPAPEEVIDENTDLQAVYDSYPANQRIMNPGDNCLDPALTPFQHFELAHQHIAEANPNKEGFEQFRANFIDAREASQAANPRAYDHPDLGRPESIKDEVDYFVLHFTAIPGDKADHYDGGTFAGAMANGNRGALVQYYINYDKADNTSKTYFLTDNFTYQVPKYDERIFGVEVAGCAQAKLRPLQIENTIYLAAMFLIDNGYLEDGKSSEQVVNDVLRGHRELNPDGHSDWPGISMDQFRAKLTTFLGDQGY